MHKIKRYANRKLYDTLEKRYVTLEDVSQLVERGEQVEVVDNETGEDITHVTLSQIIYERQKKTRDGSVPRSLFREMIQGGGSSLFESLQKLFQGGVELALLVEKEGEKLLRRFVSSGEITEEQKSALLSELKARAERTKSWITQRIDERVEQVLRRLGVVTRDELRDLLGLLDQVRQKLASIESSLEGPKKQP